MKFDPCQVCSSNDWDEDADHEELNCSTCGYTIDDPRVEKQAGGGFDEDTRAVPVESKVRPWNIDNNPLPDDIQMWMLLAEQKSDTKSEWKKIREQVSKLKKGLSIENSKGWKHNSSTKWWADARSKLFFQSEVFRSASGEAAIEDLSEELGRIADRDWKAELSHRVIRGSVVPERSLLTLDLKRITTPSRERIGVEFFVAMTEEEGGFWFLCDYARLIALNLEMIDSLLGGHHPFSNVIIDRVKKIHGSREITPAAVSEFAKKCARRLGIDPNGIEDDSSLPVGEVEEAVWELLSLGPVDSKTSVRLGWYFSPHYWVPYKEPDGTSTMETISFEDRDVEALSGGLRPVGVPIVMSHIPLAYVVAQRLFDSWRLDDTWQRHPKKILDWIGEDLRWCPGEVSQMDVWWEGVISRERGDSSSSVTILR